MRRRTRQSSDMAKSAKSGNGFNSVRIHKAKVDVDDYRGERLKPHRLGTEQKQLEKIRREMGSSAAQERAYQRDSKGN